MTWIAESHAKINLGLHILEKLPTGYHRIETGMILIEWRDRFRVSESSRFELSMSDPELPAGKENLITRAYRTFDTYVGLHRHYRFQVDKQIPTGAGLGGGSSNAALTLRILNKLEDAGLNEQELTDLSRDLGSDIAFFLQDRPAFATGLGHHIEPMKPPTDHWIVTVYPGFGSSTAEAYARCLPGEPDVPLRTILEQEPVDEWRYLLQNDLESTVVEKYEMIGHIRDQLYEFGADYAAMTGSGSAVYGLFPQDFVALQAYNAFQELDFRVNMTRPDFHADRGIYRTD